MFEQVETAWSQDSSGYDILVQKQLNNRKDVNHWQAELKRVLDGKKNLNVLDAGCGPGFFSIMLARLGHQVTSVDGAEGMVQCAARNLSSEGFKAKLYCGDAVALDREEDNSFDAIVSRDVIWTLYDPEKAYKRWLEVLKPGGILVVYDGNYRRDVRSLKIVLWKGLAAILTFLTEGRPPKKTTHAQEDVFGKLPAVTTERPLMDQTILEKLGYEVLTVEGDDYRNSFKHLEHWKYGYQGKRFKIIARKKGHNSD